MYVLFVPLLTTVSIYFVDGSRESVTLPIITDMTANGPEGKAYRHEPRDQVLLSGLSGLVGPEESCLFCLSIHMMMANMG